MVKSNPVGRVSSYFGCGAVPHVANDGTWLEDESFAYPAGGFTRRAYVEFPDGKRRVVRVSIPDTYFSIPARAKVGGAFIKGFVSGGNDGYMFTATLSENPRPSDGYSWDMDMDRGDDWQRTHDEYWEVIMSVSSELDCATYLGRRSIDGSRVNVWKLRNGRIIAQVAR